ncbi:hypothetical protein, partial [Oceanobacter kriegii]|uniref:hypothetical protein n=1 Tax=Oceanobacter kriegii TaxID=64972 RepID=UPI001B7FA411
FNPLGFGGWLVPFSPRFEQMRKQLFNVVVFATVIQPAAFNDPGVIGGDKCLLLPTGWAFDLIDVLAGLLLYAAVLALDVGQYIAAQAFVHFVH